MKKTFDEILGSMLEEYQKGEKTIEQIIAEATVEAEFTEEDKALLNEANATLEKFDEKKASLVKAKEDGKSRKRWMLDEIDKAAEGKSDDEKVELLSALETSLKERNEQLLNEE